MKSKLLILAILFIGIISFTGCATEEFYTTNVNGTQSYTTSFKIKKSEWIWSEEEGRYYSFRNFPALDKYIFDNGSAVGSVFIMESNVEVQKPLPFIHTYRENNGYTYTETISFDTSVNPSEVFFYIQASDKIRADKYLSDYEFKIVLNWVE